MSDGDENVSLFMSKAHDMVLAISPEKRITYSNAFAAEALGYSPEKLIGRNFLKGVEENSRAIAEALFIQVLANQSWHGELLLKHLDGSVFPTYLSASPIAGESGEVERVLVIAHDITERKRHEDEIRKQAELANSIIRIAPMGIFSLGTDRKFKAVNSAFGDMMENIRPGALLDEPFSKISSTLNPELVKAVELGLSGKEASVINRPLREGGPEDLIVTLIAVPLRNIEDKIEAVLVIIENRTELVRIEEQLLQADKLASTGFLAAGIAHEINNPIAGIYTIMEILAKRVRKEGGDEEPYQRILTNIDRIKDIIRRLLDFANPAQILPQKTDLNALIIQMLEFFKFHPIFRKIRVVWQLDENLPQIIVDPKQVQQVMHNLVMNAAQAMKNTGGTLTISSGVVEPAGNGLRFIEIKIHDTGVGIPEENLKRIFDPFFTTKPPGEGTGLGLSVCYSVAKHHGGELIARNHPDGGAEFILRLPA